MDFLCVQFQFTTKQKISLIDEPDFFRSINTSITPICSLLSLFHIDFLISIRYTIINQ